MKTIHLIRKPCAESSVGSNSLKHGTGPIHIHACRLGTAGDVPSVHATRKSDYPNSYKKAGAGWGRSRGGYAGDKVSWEPSGGRWPCNVFLHTQESVTDVINKVEPQKAPRFFRIFDLRTCP